MGSRGIATRIALAALASAGLGLLILALGVLVVGGQVFTELMMQAGDSAEHARSMYDSSVTTVVIANAATPAAGRLFHVIVLSAHAVFAAANTPTLGRSVDESIRPNTRSLALLTVASVVRSNLT